MLSKCCIDPKHIYNFILPTFEATHYNRRNVIQGFITLKIK